MPPVHHPVKKAQVKRAATTTPSDAPPAPAWPSYTGISQFVGTSLTGRVNVYVDPTLGPQGLQNAQDLLDDADRVIGANDEIFNISEGSTSVIIFAMDGNTDGTGGADHMSCDFVTGAAIEVCASFGNSARVSALFEAELSECCMNGNLCGFSTGEALSRWCAAVIGNNALSDFTTAPTWFQDGMPNYVDQTDPSDGNADSTGCGMAFLSWLMSLGTSLDKIAQAMVALGDSGTLAQLYATVTGDSANIAWRKFTDAINALPGGITSDDPFGGAVHPAQLSHLAPWTVELAGKVFASILADVAAGKQPNQIVAGVRAIMVSMPNAASSLAASTKMSGNGAGGSCSIRSRRLLPPK
jgi:hypothetical protein